MSKKKHIVVIGSGIVGACAAFELLRDGHSVTILDPGKPGGRQAASFGHGCWISPASVVPMSMPGLWKKVPGYLLDQTGPLVIRWRHIVRLTPWLMRFVRAGMTRRRVERTARSLALLLRDSPSRHRDLAREIGQESLIRSEGLLYAYPDKAAVEAEALAWQLRKMTGLAWRELDSAALRAREPQLSHRYQHGLLVEEGAHCIDPGLYVGSIAESCVARGATLIRARAERLLFNGGCLTGVSTAEGQALACDGVVIAAGIASKALAAQTGDSIPLESERGYHCEIDGASGGPQSPVMPSDGKMANTPLAESLRLSGQVELASAEAEPDWARSAMLLDHARKTYPSLHIPDAPQVRHWMGHRPSTPDGLPVIGPSRRSPDVIYAFGHGHVGFASGPATGRMVADLVSGRTDELETEAFRASRFAGN